MSAVQQMLVAGRSAGDPYYADVSLLLHCDGANGSTTFTDNSPSPKTVTANGGAQISTAQWKFGGSSVAFSTAGQFLSTPSDSAFTFGTGDFTIEGWLYVTSGTVGTLFDNRTSITSTHPVILLTFASVGGGQRIQLYVGGFYQITSSDVTLTGNWTHVALSKSSNSTKLFLNGVQSGSTYTDNNNYAASGTVSIGAGLAGANQLNGYIDELRITKGVARYTANFTPPTAPFPNY